MSTRAQAMARLAALATFGGAEIAIAEGALALAALDHDQDVDLGPYRAHLALLAAEIGASCRAGEAQSLTARIAAINGTMFERHGYAGDRESYDDLANADLIEVIDRRKGLPVALGIIYVHLARAQGWRAFGVNFPNHFVIALESADARAIVDPFNAGAVRDAASLAAILRRASRGDVALAPEFVAPVADRDVLIRLLNNRKSRHLAAGRKAEAARMVEHMLLIAPDRYQLWGESGVLHANAGNLKTAIERLETFLARCGPAAEKSEAAALMRRLRTQLN